MGPGTGVLRVHLQTAGQRDVGGMQVVAAQLCIAERGPRLPVRRPLGSGPLQLCSSVVVVTLFDGFATEGQLRGTGAGRTD